MCPWCTVANRIAQPCSITGRLWLAAVMAYALLLKSSASRWWHMVRQSDTIWKQIHPNLKCFDIFKLLVLPKNVPGQGIRWEKLKNCTCMSADWKVFRGEDNECASPPERRRAVQGQLAKMILTATCKGKELLGYGEGLRKQAEFGGNTKHSVSRWQEGLCC